MSQARKQRVRWHSRRGMLELDLLLMPFAEQCYDALSEAEQRLYEALLEEEDQDLWRWLLDRDLPAESPYRALLGKILAHRRNST